MPTPLLDVQGQRVQVTIEIDRPVYQNDVEFLLRKKVLETIYADRPSPSYVHDRL